MGDPINLPMHFPVMVSLGDMQFSLHSLLEFVAYFIGFRYFLYLRKKQKDPITTTHRLWILIGAISGSVLGSRLIGGLEDLHQLKIADNIFIYFYLNKTVLGGLLGGVWGVEVIKKFIKEKNSSGDLFTYPLVLALILGRLGCFSMGIYEETYGTITDFFTGINLGDNKLRHPVTLYEIAFLLLLWLSLLQIEKKYQLANGLRFKIFMITYCLFRFVLDFIKPHYTFSIGLSTIQVTALIGLLYYLVVYLNNKDLFLIKRINN
jgi:phosphatidylglycerol---prolipoprotein diacylglyceryl transferase